MRLSRYLVEICSKPPLFDVCAVPPWVSINMSPEFVPRGVLSHHPCDIRYAIISASLLPLSHACISLGVPVDVHRITRVIG